MIVIECPTCSAVFRVLGDAVQVDALVGRQSEFWPGRYPCPRCEKPARGMLEREVDPRILASSHLRDLTPEEAYAAFSGLGLPEEQQCSLEAINALFARSKVRRVTGQDIQGETRAVITSIEMDDGTRVHLAAGGLGAVIYRIVEPPSYAKRVLAEEAP